MQMTNYELNILEKESGLPVFEILTPKEVEDIIKYTYENIDYPYSLWHKVEKSENSCNYHKNKKRAKRRHDDYRKALYKRNLSKNIYGELPVKKGRVYVNNLKCNKKNGMALIYDNLHQYVDNKIHFSLNGEFGELKKDLSPANKKRKELMDYREKEYIYDSVD